MTDTKLGTIAKVGSWSIALEITKAATQRDARRAAYAIAAAAYNSNTLGDFDIRVAHFPVIAVTIEVESADDFAKTTRALANLANREARRST